MPDPLNMDTLKPISYAVELNLHAIALKDYQEAAKQQYENLFKDGVHKIHYVPGKLFKELEVIRFFLPIYDNLSTKNSEMLTVEDIVSISSLVVRDILKEERIFTLWKFVEVKHFDTYHKTFNRFRITLASAEPKWHQKVLMWIAE